MNLVIALCSPPEKREKWSIPNMKTKAGISIMVSKDRKYLLK